MPEAMQDQSRPEQTRAENTFPQTVFADHSKKPSETKNPKLTEDQVEQIYGLYPRKCGKLDAKKAIRKAVSVVTAGDVDHPAMPVEDALNYLASRVTAYAEATRNTDRDFIPYPASWFNAGSFWDDERHWKKRSTSALPDQFGTPVNILTDNVATRMRAQMEAD
jgi:hypothetical protein